MSSYMELALDEARKAQALGEVPVGCVIVSAAVYVLAYFLFTIHEEIGISADTALPLALWTFLIVFLGSLVGCLVRKARPGAR